jgi:copper homeostasis protein (lipoprotein)
MPMYGLRLLRILFVSALLALAACGRDAPSEAGVGAEQADTAEETSPSVAEDFERTWLGVLPCADCDGIQTRLVLRGENGTRRYQLEETYLGADGDNVFQQEGEWTEETTQLEGVDTTVYRLDPQGPSRWFWVQPDGGLEMLEAEGRASLNGIDYRLQRL